MDKIATNPGRVLITGGASGLGAAVATAVQEAGGTPIVLDRIKPEGMDNCYEVDVADTGSLASVIDSAVAAVGGLDAVVTAAGIDRCGRLEDVERQEWERVIAVNLLGAVGTIRACLPHLKDTHGRVVTIASSLGLKVVSDATAYCASKFGMVGFSRALALEMSGQVGVTTLVPTGMRTNFFDDRTEQYKPSDDSRLMDPAVVARSILFALSQPVGVEVRELVIAHESDDSWP